MGIPIVLIQTLFKYLYNENNMPDPMVDILNTKLKKNFFFVFFSPQGTSIITGKTGKSATEIFISNAIDQSTRVQNAVLGCSLKNDRMISVHFQGKLFNITVIQVYDPTIDAEEAEVDQFYEDMQDHLELTTKNNVIFITRDWNEKV